jgi:hypothetical protein
LASFAQATTVGSQTIFLLAKPPALAKSCREPELQTLKYCAMKAFACSLSLLLISISLRADIISQWNFNSTPPDGDPGTGTLTASVGYGTVTFLNGITNTFSDGSTNDPASGPDDSGLSTSHYPAQGTSNKTAGVQFNLSTTGYSNIVVRWDQRTTSTASKYFRLQYSTDGATFMDYPTPLEAQLDSTYEARTNSLAAITAVNNNPNFAFRIVAEWESTAALSGTNGYVVRGSGYSVSQGAVRFDYVTITGTPLPGSDTPPYISTPIADQTVRVNQSTGPIDFTVLDAEDAASNLVVDAMSSDPAVIAPANISFGGYGSTRTVNVTAGSQSGASIIRVWVIDSGGKSNSAPFTVTVLPANTAPIISAIPATNTLVNTGVAPIAFTIGDAESPATDLILSAVSENPALVPNVNVVFGGSGSNRTVSVTPSTDRIGVAPITVRVSDGTNSASSTFGVMVRPSPAVLVYEPFDYHDGSVVTNSGFLWNNHTGASGQCQVTNGQLQVTTSQTEDVAITLPGGPYAKNAGTILYTSFKVNFQALPKNTPDYFAAFVSGSSQIARLYAGSATNAPAGTFQLAIANASNSTTPYADDLNTNTTYVIVTRYNIDTAIATMWLNPASETDPGVTATDALTPASASSFLFRQGSSLGATILIDDLKIGLSFASVTTSNSTTAATPIPLVLERFGNNVILTWTNPAFLLQSAPAMNSLFTNIPSAASPYTSPISPGARFFRLQAN